MIKSECINVDTKIRKTMHYVQLQCALFRIFSQVLCATFTRCKKIIVIYIVCVKAVQKIVINIYKIANINCKIKYYTVIIAFTIWKIIFHLNKQIINIKSIVFKLYSCWTYLTHHVNSAQNNNICVMEKCGKRWLIVSMTHLFRSPFSALWFHPKWLWLRSTWHYKYFETFLDWSVSKILFSDWSIKSFEASNEPHSVIHLFLTS